MGVTLECRRPVSGFDRDVYAMEAHAFCNSIVIPHSYFAQISAEPYSYVRVSPAFTDGYDASAILYAIPFDRETGPDGPLTALSTNLMEEIHPDLGTGDHVRVRSIDIPSDDQLVVRRPYSGEQPAGCYVSEETLEKIDCDVGESVEIISKRTGERAVSEVHLLKPNDESNESIRLDLSIIQSMNIDLGDRVKVQTRVEERGRTLRQSVKKAVNRVVFESLVGSRKIKINVRRGLQQDEERNIVRIGTSTRQYLGIEIQDKVKLKWKEREVAAQCLPPTADDDSTRQSLSPAEVSIPSTLRDKIRANPNDTVSLHRDREYMFREQIGVSILGILGVIFGTFQVLNATGWIPVLVESLGRVRTTLLILGIAGVLSVPTLFLLFLPTRSEVN